MNGCIKFDEKKKNVKYRREMSIMEIMKEKKKGRRKSNRENLGKKIVGLARKRNC